MKTRPLQPSDVQLLARWAEASGFPYVEPNGGTYVVVDEEDRPVMACAPHQIMELYLWADPEQAPAVKLYALRLLHDGMIPAMQALGIHEVNAFLPPEIEWKFGRRLMRTFGWVRNWPSFAKRF